MDVARLYCERRGPGLGAEPLNALTNAAFFVAALVAWRLVRRGGRPADLSAAAALVAVVGIGSTLWHTLAAPWAQAADVAPIGALVFLMLGSVLARLFARNRRFVVVALASFAAVHVPVLVLWPRALGGSVLYLPAWATLLAIAIAAARSPAPQARAAARGLAVTAALLTASLIFRTIDLPLCPVWPAGTHFLWHVLNASLLLVLIGTVARAAPGPPRA